VAATGNDRTAPDSVDAISGGTAAVGSGVAIASAVSWTTW
jgi:Na+/H+-translocating membrane pyrophosphatase